MVTSEIDVSLFQPLFKEGRMGAPNASIRRLVAMSVLKEGFGCSDEELMEKCDYDSLTRKTLGLIKMEVLSSYPAGVNVLSAASERSAAVGEEQEEQR